MEFKFFSEFIEQIKMKEPRLIILIQGILTPIGLIDTKYYRTISPMKREYYINLINTYRNDSKKLEYQKIFFGDDDQKKKNLCENLFLMELGYLPNKFNSSTQLDLMLKRKNQFNILYEDIQLSLNF